MSRDKLAELINFRIKEASNHSGSLNDGGMGGWIAYKMCDIGFELRPEFAYIIKKERPYAVIKAKVNKIVYDADGMFVDCTSIEDNDLNYCGYIEDFEEDNFDIFFTKEQADARVLELKFGWGK